MSDENHRDDEINLNLDLSLVFSQEQDPVEEQGNLFPQEQVPVEEQSHSQFMQLLRSDLPQNIQHSRPQHYMMSPVTILLNVPTPALPPYPPPPSVLAAAPLPYQPSGQFLHLPQPIQVETVALDGRHIGRPPKGHQARRNSSRAGAVKTNVGDKEIEPPYPWATKKTAIHQTVRDLCEKGITEISGQVYCKSCDKTQTLVYKLMEKFPKLIRYIEENVEVMRHRAPSIWMTPKLIPCETCGSEMKPVISEKKEEINWLFLLLGQMLGCCTLEQLKFFCESITQHRTGSKNHVLYTTYLGLCKQLEPDAKFKL